MCHIVRVNGMGTWTGGDGALHCRHLFFFRDEDKADAVILQHLFIEYYDNYCLSPCVILKSVIITEDETRFFCEGTEFKREGVLSRMKNTRDAMKEPDVMIRLGEPPLGIFHLLDWAYRCMCCFCCWIRDLPERRDTDCSYSW